MTLLTLVRRNLSHYWQTNLAVIAGVSVAVSVLTGALLVGSSVRSSLRDLALERLGATDQVITSAGFVRESLADEEDIRGAPPAAYLNPNTGPGGEDLAVDVAWFGPPEAGRILVLQSATHGVEGFTGSAAQLDWLTEDGPSRLPGGVAALLSSRPWMRSFRSTVGTIVGDGTSGSFFHLTAPRSST